MSKDFTPWQQRLFERASAMRAAGRLPHALLICGPEQLGKRGLAEALAQSLLCVTPKPAGEACGACAACSMFGARFQRDPIETRPDETPAHPAGHPGHPDARFVGFALNEKSSPKKMYQELVIDQIRELSAWLALTPSSERGKVALIEPAHAMNAAASNALLKTLEEPIPGRYLILVSDQPARLPATIRSRCQRLEMKLPPREEALSWMRGQGIAEMRAIDALDANLGHPGLAMAELRDGGAALRSDVCKDLAALSAGRTRATAVAQAWVPDRLALRLRYACEAVREFAAASAAGEPDRSALARAGLSPWSDVAGLGRWFEQAGRTVAWLRTPLRQDLMVAELLREWRSATTQATPTVPTGALRR